MSNRKLAAIVFAVSLVGTGSAFAAQPAFPSSVDESAPLSIPLVTSRDVTRGAASSMFPSSPSEASQFTFSANAMTTAPGRLGASYGSVFPSSAIETGGRI